LTFAPDPAQLPVLAWSSGLNLEPKMSKRAPDPFPVFKPRGTPANLDGFDRSMADTADHLVRELERAERLPSRKGNLTREGVRFLAYALVVHRTRNGEALAEDHLRLLASALGIPPAYALVVHRTRNGEALAEDHLRLLASALGIRPDHVPSGAAAFLGLPPIRASHYLKFVRAADADREPDISENELAKRVGVDRGTIRSWRKMKAYRERVRGADPKIVAGKKALQALIKAQHGGKPPSV
jgi:hypothetical protein